MKYFWTAFSKDTGEIAECGIGYRSLEGAHKAALRFLKGDWGYADGAVVEVWDGPNVYSGQAFMEKTLVSRKEYVREGYNPEHLREVMRALGEPGMTEEEFLEELGPWDQKDRWVRTKWVEK